MWPCLTWKGRGWNYDPADPPCAVEGYRNVRTVRCTACGGRGEGTKAAIAQAYHKALERWRSETEEYNHLAQARNTALQRLTKDEIKALRELGI